MVSCIGLLGHLTRSLCNRYLQMDAPANLLTGYEGEVPGTQRSSLVWITKAPSLVWLQVPTENQNFSLVWITKASSLAWLLNL
jgi:hypothetical protein